MLFNSLQYLLFLPVVVLAFWLLPRRFRPFFLLLASYFFYMSWLKAYGLLLGGLTLWNYVFGMLLGREGAQNKRLLFIAAVAGNIGALCLFKYTNFIIETVWSVGRALSGLSPAGTMGVPIISGLSPAATMGAPLLNIVLPLGISFFVFEFVHYLTDIYKGDKPIRNFIRFGLFASFFPSQIAGPIKRYQDFDHQVVESKPFDKPLFQSGLWLIAEGMFKKVVLGDNLAQIVQAGYSATNTLSTQDAWLVALAFIMQIYYDFSGYTDIGRGSAMLFGIKLPENFDMPWLARSFNDFWRRWHISLSSWLRDYLYIPLGGSKSGRLMQVRNLLITMVIGGLWHGAAWHFAAWGAAQGVGLTISHMWQRWTDGVPSLCALRSSLIWQPFAWLLTIGFWMVTWVFFRADTMEQAMQVFRAMSGFADPSSVNHLATLLMQTVLPAAFPIYMLFYWAKRGVTAPTLRNNWWLQPPMAAQLIAIACFGLIIVGLAPTKAVPFIYFQF